jgi:acyl-coenzyme A synthetase/AMP-(fatty) acid ligase
LRLARLLAEADPSRGPVCFARDGAHDLEELRARAAGLAARLRAEGAGRWLLHCEDSWAFAVALFAVAHAGATAVLLPNRQPGALARAAPLAAGALLDAAPEEARAALGAGAAVIDPLDDAAYLPGTQALSHLDPRAPLLELSTSGTTGEGKWVTKALRHLDAEIAVLEAELGGELGPATQVFATASHQHIYGLLYRVLWPLAAGRPFHAPTYLHARELLPRIEEAGDAALASTPSHLRRMTGLERARGACREVFCSGGPLDSDAADAVRAALGRAPIEVFGSTETGGVAWRRQEAGAERLRWTLLPGVRVARVEGGPDAGRLRVESPFVSAGAPEAGGRAAFTMGDLVEVAGDRRFLLLGRGDRVVKIGEKRLALAEMEARLRAHPCVEDASLLALEQGGETRVAAALVLSDAGRAALASEGRRAVSARLAEDLAAYWDRVLLPRAFRYVDALPRDAQGKTTVALLRELFAGARGPLLHAEERSELGVVRDATVPEDLAFLEGHFEGFPVVPGVVQLGWALEAAEAALGAPPEAAAIESLKFKEALLPGQRFRLEVEWSAARDVLRFRLAAGERVFATGRVRLRAPSGAPPASDTPASEGRA